MRVVCIYTAQHPVSCDRAARCLESAEPFGIAVDLHPSVYWTDIKQTATDLGLAWRLQPHTIRRTTTTHCPAFRIANGLTHYQLYQECAAGTDPICILEHDAVFVAPLPDTIPAGITAVSSHKPGQIDEDWYQSGIDAGRYKAVGPVPDFTQHGIIPHPYSKTSGTSGYIITPDAADALVRHIQVNGVANADCLYRDIFGGKLWLAIPQPAEMHKVRIDYCEDRE